MSVPIGRGQIMINHLLFVDDSLLFCKANSLDWCMLQNILEQYERACGQTRNKDKKTPCSLAKTLFLTSSRDYYINFWDQSLGFL